MVCICRHALKFHIKFIIQHKTSMDQKIIQWNLAVNSPCISCFSIFQCSSAVHIGTLTDTDCYIWLDETTVCMQKENSVCQYGSAVTPKGILHFQMIRIQFQCCKTTFSSIWCLSSAELWSSWTCCELTCQDLTKIYIYRHYTLHYYQFDTAEKFNLLRWCCKFLKMRYSGLQTRIRLLCL